MIYSYNNSSLFDNDGFDDADLEVSDSFFEALLIEESSKFTDEQRKEFVNSDLSEVLINEGRMRRNTIVRIGQNDDLERRKILAVIDLAKKNNDPLYTKYFKKRKEEKEALASLVKKYSFKAEKIAKASQKDYIKNRMPKSFGKLSDFGNGNR